MRMSVLMRYLVTYYMLFIAVIVNHMTTLMLYLYFKVIFVELNRDESQRYLDLMKQDIVSDTNNENVTKLMELEV